MFSAYTKTDCFRPEWVIRDEIGSNLSYKMSLCHLLQLSVVVSSCVAISNRFLDTYWHNLIFIHYGQYGIVKDTADI